MAIKRLNPNSRKSTAKTDDFEVKAEVRTTAKPMPRAKRAPAKPRPVRAQVSPPPETYQSGTFLSREEKRQIILAHANMRRPQDPVQMMSMWAGVLACLLIVAAGWWWTVRPEIGKQFSSSVKPALAQGTEDLKSAGQLLKDLSDSGMFRKVDANDPKIKELTEKVNAQKEALFHYSSADDAVATGTEAVQGRNIFIPAGTSSSTESVTTDVEDEKKP